MFRVLGFHRVTYNSTALSSIIVSKCIDPLFGSKQTFILKECKSDIRSCAEAAQGSAETIVINDMVFVINSATHFNNFGLHHVLGMF